MVDAGVKMVVVDGVRYRPEDAPKQKDGGEVQHKARRPAAAAKSSSKSGK